VEYAVSVTKLPNPICLLLLCLGWWLFTYLWKFVWLVNNSKSILCHFI